MIDQNVEKQIADLLGSYGWVFITGLALLVFRTTLGSIVEGLRVFLGNDINTDDILNVNGRPARVVRCGIWKTIFYIYTIDTTGDKPTVSSGTKLCVQNDMLKTYLIEKPLPLLDLNPYELEIKKYKKEKENGK